MFCTIHGPSSVLAMDPSSVLDNAEASTYCIAKFTKILSFTSCQGMT